MRPSSETPEYAAFKAAADNFILTSSDEAQEAKREAVEALHATPEWQYEHRDYLEALRKEFRKLITDQENSLRAMQAAEKARTQETSKRQNEKRRETTAAKRAAKVLTPAQLQRKAQNERAKAKKDAKKAGS